MGRLLVLASGSPQRKLLLKELGRPFKIVPSGVSEDSAERDPRRLVLELAERKARDVAAKYPKALVLGADTLVVCRGEILGKPATRPTPGASSTSSTAAGRRSIPVWRWRRGKVFCEAVSTRVLARRLPEKILRRLAGKHLDKAGAYAVQDQDDPFIERIVGEFDNVVGLPMKAVRRLLRKAERAAA